MDVCPRVSVLCCPVSVEALHRADPPAKESYQMSLYVDREALRVGQRSAKDCKCLFRNRVRRPDREHNEMCMRLSIGKMFLFCVDDSHIPFQSVRSPSTAHTRGLN
jgi:hypothetical protein